MKRIRKIKSIYGELILIIILAAAVSAAFFLVYGTAITNLTDAYYDSTTVIRRMEKKYADSLQNYVSRNHLRTSDDEKLDEWVDNHGVLTVLVVKNGEVVYYSDYTDNSDDEDRRVHLVSANPENEPERSIRFRDGKAKVYFDGLYSYYAYLAILVTNIAFSFFLYLIIVLAGVRSKIVRIRKMKKEIEILESGNLDYPFTVAGEDEIEKLAGEIDAMRLALKDQISREQAAMKNSRDLVTEVSHDLRTPLTSILLYSDMLLSGRCESPDQMKNYIRRISVKAHQLKTLTDDLFEYALVGQGRSIELQTASFRELFYDPLSTLIELLESSGYECEGKPDWSDQPVLYNPDHISRIFDNIVSNILKYADPAAPVQISSEFSQGHASIRFRNRIRLPQYSKDSNHIGLKNVKKMMEAMDGACETAVDETTDTFSLTLRFRKSVS